MRRGRSVGKWYRWDDSLCVLLSLASGALALNAFAFLGPKARCERPLLAARAAKKPYFLEYSSEDVSGGYDENVGAGKMAVIAGASGYIGRSVVREAVSRGYRTVALVRDLDRLALSATTSLSHSGDVKFTLLPAKHSHDSHDSQDSQDSGNPPYGSYQEAFAGAAVVECDVTDSTQLADLLSRLSLGTSPVNSCFYPNNNLNNNLNNYPNNYPNNYLNNGENSENSKNSKNGENVDVLISCLASASGIQAEVEAIDYQATLNLLNAGRQSTVKARHFVLLSAFCVRNPLLKLQQAKLKFEAALQNQQTHPHHHTMTYTIVRPTAFFKSVSGQLESIQTGNAYVLFGDGQVTRCNPISEEDLATYILDSAILPHKCNRILNVGGPDAPLTNRKLGQMMFQSIGKKPKFVYVPTQIFDLSINLISYISQASLFVEKLLISSQDNDTNQQQQRRLSEKEQKWDDILETAKIGKYYAVEDMLTTEQHEKFGTMTMQQHFDKIATQGQDPFAPVRATAFISQTLEALPAITISIPLGYGILTKSNVVQAVMASSSSLPSSNPLLANFANVPLLLADLNDNFFPWNNF